MSELAISAQDARNLTDKIKVGTAALWELIKEAYASRAWASLGYASWDDYCTQEFGTSRIRLPREERQEVVASMREIGMSVRAIASATGDSYGTVRNELAAREQNCSPEPAPVTGTDGKTYEGRRTTKIQSGAGFYGPGEKIEMDTESTIDTDTGEILEEHPIPKEDKPRAEATTKQFMAAVADLNRILDRFHKIKTSPNYRNNIDQLTQTHASDIDRAIDELVDLRNTLN